jgi:hypothetical protein
MAVLEIRGHKVTAEFLRGVPQEGRIGLVLERRDGDALFFRMAAPGAAPSGAGISLSDHMLVNPMYIERGMLSRALYALRAGNTGIFGLNAMVADPDGRGRGRFDRYKELLNKMKDSGIKPDLIKFFSSLFAPLGGTLLIYVKAFLAQLYRKTGNNAFENDPHQPWAGEYPQFEDEINRFIKEIEEVFRAHGGMDSGFLCDLIEFSGSSQLLTAGEVFFCEVPLPGDETVSALVMANDNSLVFCLDLTGLGHLEGVIRDSAGALTISIYCDTAESRDELSHDIGELSDLVEGSDGRNPRVRVLLTKDVIAGMETFLSNGAMAGSLDIKA